MSKRSTPEPSVGDLVTHILMDKSWLGVVLKLKNFKPKGGEVSKNALVHISSDHVFSPHYREKKDRYTQTNKIGWVDIAFLKVVAPGEKL